jgi:hypothetical protein
MNGNADHFLNRKKGWFQNPCIKHLYHQPSLAYAERISFENRTVKQVKD